jgi:hypothetical protein
MDSLDFLILIPNLCIFSFFFGLRVHFFFSNMCKH